MNLPAPDGELFELIRRELYSPVLGDVLDQCGLRHQILPQPIQPLTLDMKLVGRAMPVLMIDIHDERARPFGSLTDSLDQLKPHEVYVATGGSMRCAYWGEIMTATARMRQAAGAIVNGFHRDTPKVLEQRWPVFSRGRYAQDSRVRSEVLDYRCRVEIDSVSIEPGDLIFADLDGIVVVPRSVEREVIEKSVHKARQENIVRKQIESGMSSTDALRRYNVL